MRLVDDMVIRDVAFIVSEVELITDIVVVAPVTIVELVMDNELVVIVPIAELVDIGATLTLALLVTGVNVMFVVDDKNGVITIEVVFIVSEVELITDVAIVVAPVTIIELVMGGELAVVVLSAELVDIGVTATLPVTGNSVMFIVDDINGVVIREVVFIVSKVELITDVAVVAIVKLVTSAELVDIGLIVTLALLVTGVGNTIIVDDINDVVVTRDVMFIVSEVESIDTVVLSNGSTLSTHSLISSINNITLLLPTIVTLNIS